MYLNRKKEKNFKSKGSEKYYDNSFIAIITKDIYDSIKRKKPVELSKIFHFERHF